jgi:hypothetical protein
MLIKGQTLKTWHDWVVGELTPPIVMTPNVTYLAEAFRDAIEELQRHEADSDTE